MITERQFDPATERMQEQLFLLSGGYYKRSIVYQCSLHCVDGTAELNIAFAPIHERLKQPGENKTLSLRVADLIASDSVRSIKDDRGNSCRQGGTRQRDAKVHLGFHPIWLLKKETTFNEVGARSERKTGNSRGRYSVCGLLVQVLCVVTRWSIFSGSVGAHVLSLFPSFPSGTSWLAMDGSDTSSTFTCSSLLTSQDPDKCDEHNIWNPMLELLCHTHLGISMEALFDEEGMGRITLSCHFALDILCDKE